jgi:hypothetical protein
MDQQAETRCSDADRERIATELRRHAVEGRLDPAELDERLSHALQARTRSELYETLENLPARRPGGPWSQRIATMPTSTATAAVVAVLAVALWVTGHLGEDGMMWAVAVAVLLFIWRRPRQRRDS